MPDTEVELYPQDLALHIAGHEDAKETRYYYDDHARVLVLEEFAFSTFASLSRANQQAVIDAANRHARSLCYEEEPVFTPEEAAEIRKVMAPFGPVLDWSKE